LIIIGLILWICLIFLMSSDMDSNSKTIMMSEEIYRLLSGFAHGANSGLFSADQIDFLLRKGGHFLEYLVLCLLLLKIREVYMLESKLSVTLILLICLLIANLDEFRQSFIIGRTSMVGDSLIDFAGSLTGLLIHSVRRGRAVKKENR